ncbi:MAG: ACT domain-containing protein, partial [Acidobacteria bacterium]|nr:ACT domain-containing protein [Acidobacteriota bacterium]
VNLTRFLLIGTAPEPVDPRQPAKTSLVMVVRHRPGALLECLRVFDDLRINLSKLESRPLPEKPWAYRFFVDLEGHAEQEPVASALAKVRRLASHLKVLGSYARRTGLEGPVELPAPGDRARVETGAAEAVAPEAVDGEGAPGSAGVAGGLFEKDRSVVHVGEVELGTGRVVLMVRPHRVRGRQDLMTAASVGREAGARVLVARVGGGAGDVSPEIVASDLLEISTSVGHAYEMPVVATAHRPEEVARLAERVEMIRIAAADMESRSLLEETGRCAVPILLERGLSATIEDVLAAAERILAGGNQQVVLCERGIRTFETATRATLDLSAVPLLKARTHLPVVVDPCRPAPTRDLAVSLALAAVAAGADGLVLELDASPAALPGDEDSSALTPDDLHRLAEALPRLTA